MDNSTLTPDSEGSVTDLTKKRATRKPRATKAATDKPATVTPMTRKTPEQKAAEAEAKAKAKEADAKAKELAKLTARLVKAAKAEDGSFVEKASVVYAVESKELLASTRELEEWFDTALPENRSTARAFLRASRAVGRTGKVGADGVAIATPIRNEGQAKAVANILTAHGEAAAKKVLDAVTKDCDDNGVALTAKIIEEKAVALNYGPKNPGGGGGGPRGRKVPTAWIDKIELLAVEAEDLSELVFQILRQADADKIKVGLGEEQAVRDAHSKIGDALDNLLSLFKTDPPATPLDDFDKTPGGEA